MMHSFNSVFKWIVSSAFQSMPTERAMKKITRTDSTVTRKKTLSRHASPTEKVSFGRGP